QTARHTCEISRHACRVPTESAKSILEGGFSRTRDDDRLIASLAERQHGVVARRQTRDPQVPVGPGSSTRTAFREDRARDRRLVAAGYTVTRITWNQLDDEPEAIAADLRELLSRPRRPSRP
ncbi:MAG TPA: hypothetical protein VGK41_09400, partial [Solirubrobacterales bacterium]